VATLDKIGGILGSRIRTVVCGCVEGTVRGKGRFPSGQGRQSLVGRGSLSWRGVHLRSQEVGERARIASGRAGVQLEAPPGYVGVHMPRAQPQTASFRRSTKGRHIGRYLDLYAYSFPLIFIQGAPLCHAGQAESIYEEVLFIV